MADITMPQLGETVTEGTITKWFKQVGDKIEEDELLFEVSTDKVDSEVPSSEAGYVAEILVPEGETVDVGTRLAVITGSPPEGGGEAPEEAEAPAEAEAPEDAAEAPEQQPEAPGREELSSGEEAEQEQVMAEKAADAATEAPGPETDASAEERAAEPATPARAAPPATEAPARGDADGGRAAPGGRLLSPVVRRLISENDLDPGQIQGTGAGGRITRNDVLAVIEGRAPRRQEAPAAAGAPQAQQPAARQAPARAEPARRPGPAAAEPAPAAIAGERDEVVPFTNIRRRTAEHMMRSQATSAHTLVVIEVDYENVETVRRARKESFRADEGVGLTYLPFVARAVVDAIREFPHVNASVGDDELIVHRYVNMGIAVDLDFEGLMVPVVHDADAKRLRALAREIAGLARRARDRKLSPDDIAGGTFTITNPGPYGTLITGPIINQPQVTILSTDGVRKRPVVVELPDGSDAIAIHPVGNVAISFDHRAYDGAYASAFLAKVKEILETRDWEAELV